MLAGCLLGYWVEKKNTWGFLAVQFVLENVIANTYIFFQVYRACVVMQGNALLLRRT